MKKIAVAAAAAAAVLTVTTAAAAQISDEPTAAVVPPQLQDMRNMANEAEALHIGEDVLYDYRFDTAKGTVIVNRTKASPADEQWLALGAEHGVTVELKTSKWTMHEAEERIDEIWDEIRDLPGIKLSGTAYDPNGVKVYVQEGLDQARAYFDNDDDVLSVTYRKGVAL